MVFKKVLVSDTWPSFESGPQSSLVWSGKYPDYEEVDIIDEHGNVTTERQQVIPALVAIVDKQEHTRRRRPWTKGFSTSALKGYESLVIKRTLQLVEVLLSKNLKEAVDLSTWIMFYGYATVILAFGLNWTPLRYSYDVMTDIACVS